MTLQQLRVLAAVASARTFGGAALDLDISQAAVSQAVAALEKELGARLFERGNSGAHLTPLGARVHEHALLALRMESAIREEVLLERGVLSATLKVEALESISVHVLPGVLARLAEQHPGVNVELVRTKPDPTRHFSLSTVEALRKGAIDAGFLQLPIGDDAALDALLVWPLAEESYVAIASEHILDEEHAQGRCTDDLLARIPIALDVSAACAMLVTDYLHTRIGPREARYRADEATIIQLVARGAAVSILPRSTVASLPDGVVRLEMEDPPVRVLAAAIAPGRLKVPALRAFLGALRARYPEAGLPPEPSVTQSR